MENISKRLAFTALEKQKRRHIYANMSTLIPNLTDGIKRESVNTATIGYAATEHTSGAYTRSKRLYCLLLKRAVVPLRWRKKLYRIEIAYSYANLINFSETPAFLRRILSFVIIFPCARTAFVLVCFVLVQQRRLNTENDDLIKCKNIPIS